MGQASQGTWGRSLVVIFSWVHCCSQSSSAILGCCSPCNSFKLFSCAVQHPLVLGTPKNKLLYIGAIQVPHLLQAYNNMPHPTK